MRDSGKISDFNIAWGMRCCTSTHCDICPLKEGLKDGVDKCKTNLLYLALDFNTRLSEENRELKLKLEEKK